MNQHCTFYEQYCWVMKKNIIFEETFFHDGKRSLRCMHLDECDKNEGCTNPLMRRICATRGQA